MAELADALVLGTSVLRRVGSSPTRCIGEEMYRIIGNYYGKHEVLDECESREEALELVYEYKMAFGSSWIIFHEKV